MQLCPGTRSEVEKDTEMGMETRRPAELGHLGSPGVKLGLVCIEIPSCCPVRFWNLAVSQQAHCKLTPSVSSSVFCLFCYGWLNVPRLPRYLVMQRQGLSDIGYYRLEEPRAPAWFGELKKLQGDAPSGDTPSKPNLGRHC